MPYLAAYDLKQRHRKSYGDASSLLHGNPRASDRFTVGYFFYFEESVTDVPNYFLRISKDLIRLRSPDFPITAANGWSKKGKIQYTRADGLNLTAMLYTPKGYDKAKDGPLPGPDVGLSPGV
ncbi:MAG: hypothetical protein IPF93_08375 [Saprospiraceae bacterium]|nr:hypothetical protein [Saprospiraceae bacterium]